jgi:tRNA-2-methylthio-N6-dimethylallyladenosine synthase
MNEYDSEIMAGLLEMEGYALTDDEREAGIILFNTCSVRQHAEDRVWGKLYSLRERAQKEPALIVGVCGCMAQLRAEEIARKCPHVRLVYGTRAFVRLPKLVERAAKSRGTLIDTGTEKALCLADLPRVREGKLRSFVSIMRGCENFCSYCVVPYVRGHEMSRPPGEIVEEIENLAKAGCREVTLLGQNVNSYRGREKGRDTSFAQLLGMVGAVRGVERIRFMTSHPKDLREDLIEAIAGVDEVCEHLHLPLQSGSDSILKSMNRKYTYEQYRSIVKRVRQAIPGIALSTDVMAGFPGEKEEDHLRTKAAMEEIGFDSAFIFKYSDRIRTAAAGFTPKVPRGEIERRHAELLNLQERNGLRRNRELIGQSVEVFVEGYSRKNPGRLFGRTRTNKRVVFKGGKDLIGEFVFVTIGEATPLTLLGDRETSD